MRRDALADGSLVEDFLDDMLPDAIDWRHLVEKYPLACVAAAAVAGFWLARTRKEMILAAAGSYLAASVGEAVQEIGERVVAPEGASGARIGGSH
jgi:hypothetical protein